MTSDDTRGDSRTQSSGPAVLSRALLAGRSSPLRGTELAIVESLDGNWFERRRTFLERLPPQSATRGGSAQDREEDKSQPRDADQTAGQDRDAQLAPSLRVDLLVMRLADGDFESISRVSIRSGRC